MPEIVQGIRFTREEVETFVRTLPHGFDNALGDDEKERAIVRRWRGRLTNLERDENGDRAYTEVFYPKDLAEAKETLASLADYFYPQMQVDWWRDYGAPLSSEEALAGLAQERQFAVRWLGEAISIIEDALGLLSNHSLREEAAV